MFADNLKRLRKEYGLSQSELAKELNFSQSTIGMWENAKREPNLTALKDIADFFGVSVDYLIGNDSIDGNDSFTVPEEADNKGINEQSASVEQLSLLDLFDEDNEDNKDNTEEKEIVSETVTAYSLKEDIQRNKIHLSVILNEFDLKQSYFAYAIIAFCFIVGIILVFAIGTIWLALIAIVGFLLAKALKFKVTSSSLPKEIYAIEACRIMDTLVYLYEHGNEEDPPLNFYGNTGQHLTLYYKFIYIYPEYKGKKLLCLAKAQITDDDVRKYNHLNRE